VAIIAEIQGPGFFVFFQNEYPEGGADEFFDFPDTPPKRKVRAKKKKKKRKKIALIVERIAKKVVNRTKVDQELALRLAIIDEELVYNELYMELLVKEVKKRKKRRKAYILLLSGDR